MTYKNGNKQERVQSDGLTMKGPINAADTCYAAAEGNPGRGSGNPGSGSGNPLKWKPGKRGSSATTRGVSGQVADIFEVG